VADDRQVMTVRGPVSADERRILLSHDTCKFPQFRRHGGPGFTYLHETFIPKLSAKGVPPTVIDTITRANPADWLAGRVS
jgi:predicted metal-dependent phosphotriesterase family hydrolase